MRAMKFRINTADKAWMSELLSQQKKKNQDRYMVVVQACLLHTSDSWRWTKELADAQHGWAKAVACRTAGARRWTGREIPLDVHHANQIRLARKRIRQHDVVMIEEMLLKRFWNLATMCWPEENRSNNAMLTIAILSRAS